jgi:hypothetical protein
MFPSRTFSTHGSTLSRVAPRLLAVALLAVGTAACSDDDAEPCTGARCASSTEGSGASGASGGSGATGAQGGSGGEASGAAGGEGGSGATGGTGGAGGEGGGEAVWHTPQCATVAGTSAVTFTSDEGATLADTPGMLQGVGYTWALAALDTPNHLLAEHKGTLLSSTDAGCVWTEVTQLGASPLVFTAARGDRVYAWSDNGSTLLRIDGTTVTALAPPFDSIVGVGVDATDGLHLRVGTGSGAQHDSIDGGVTWTKQGTPAPSSGLGYRFVFDAQDLDHALYGQASDGAMVTFDGGSNWVPSDFATTNGVNAFNLAISAVDGNIVWLEGLELGPDMRHVWRSEDGGATFASVVDDSPTTVLFNGNLLVPHPVETDVLYFVFGSAFQGYGTDVYRYDHASGMVTMTHNDYHDVGAIVASPADPSLLYFGLTVEQIN